MFAMSSSDMLVSKGPSRTKLLASCAVKFREQLAIMIIRCKIYFVFFIFVVCTNHENIFTTKISRSTVCVAVPDHI